MTGKESTLNDLSRRIKSYDQVDFHELRLDFLKEEISPEMFERLPDKDRIILSYRPVWANGAYQGNEEKRIETLIWGAKSGVRFVDIEWQTQESLRLHLFEHLPLNRRILSYHLTNENPSAVLDAINDAPVAMLKLVIPIQDASELSGFKSLTESAKKPLILIGSNLEGLASRMAYPVFGGIGTFVTSTSDMETALGQCSWADALRFGMRLVTSETKLIGLLRGKHVKSSRGIQVYNPIFQAHDLPIRYVPLPTDHLEKSLQMLRSYPFLGSSVTMPHKESILPLLDDLDISAKSIGAVNTVVAKHDMLIGHNTDAPGFLSALCEKIDPKEKTAVVLGAGGAARAIVYALVQTNAHVIVYNRTFFKAKMLADAFGVCAAHLTDPLPERWDILVNTIPDSRVASEVLSPGDLKEKTICDIVIDPVETPLCEKAKHLGAQVIPGLRMWAYQGKAQLALWTNLNLSADLLIHQAQH